MTLTSMGFFHQLRLLMWKNCILKRRQWLCVICGEFIIPGFLFAILLLVRYLLEPQSINEATTFNVTEVYDLSLQIPDPGRDPPYNYTYTVGYSPANTRSGLEESVMKRVKQKMVRLTALHEKRCTLTKKPKCITYQGTPATLLIYTSCPRG